ncbi:MAG: hypothetical protein AB7U38_09025 [Hyphomicrobiales bacterium]
MAKQSMLEKVPPETIGPAKRPSGLVWKALVLAAAIAAVMLVFIYASADLPDSSIEQAPVTTPTENAPAPPNR